MAVEIPQSKLKSIMIIFVVRYFYLLIFLSFELVDFITITNLNLIKMLGTNVLKYLTNLK